MYQRFDDGQPWQLFFSRVLAVHCLFTSGFFSSCCEYSNSYKTDVLLFYWQVSPSFSEPVFFCTQVLREHEIAGTLPVLPVQFFKWLWIIFYLVEQVVAALWYGEKLNIMQRQLNGIFSQLLFHLHVTYPRVHLQCDTTVKNRTNPIPLLKPRMTKSPVKL